MVIKIRKTDKKVERKQRPKEQQDALAGGELPSPDFVPAPTQQESMDMFRRMRNQDIQGNGGRTPQSKADKKSIMTQGDQMQAVVQMHVKTMRDLGYDDETIRANLPSKVLGRFDETMDKVQNSDRPFEDRKQDLLDLRDQKTKMQDLFFAPPSGEEPRMKKIEEEIRTGKPAREPASRLTNSEQKRKEFESGKLRLDSIYYPAGHERAGELTQHGAQMWSEIQQDSLLDAPKTKEPNGKK